MKISQYTEQRLVVDLMKIMIFCSLAFWVNLQHFLSKKHEQHKACSLLTKDLGVKWVTVSINNLGCETPNYAINFVQGGFRFWTLRF